MQIRLYNFSKRVNSTLLPNENNSTHVDYEGTIKDDVCNIMAPVITFKLNAINAPTFNYAYIEKFNRYYFIEDWVYAQGLWIATMAIDVLASSKPEILASDQYVVRSTSESDPWLMDGTYTTRGYVDRSIIQGTGIDTTQANGLYILGVGGGRNSNEDTSYYAMYAAELNQLLDFLYGTTAQWDLSGLDFGASGITPDVLKTLSNPINYISSLKFFPTLRKDQVTNDASDVRQISMGWLNTGINAVKVKYHTCNIPVCSQQFILPQHPQSGVNTKWLNFSPYTTAQLTFKPFGTLPLEYKDWRPYNYIVNTDAKVDLVTGEAILRVYGNTGNPSKPDVVAYMSGQWAISKRIGQLTQNYQEAFQSQQDIKNLGYSYSLNAEKKEAASMGIIGGIASGLSNIVLGAPGAVAGEVQRKAAETEMNIIETNAKTDIINSLFSMVPTAMIKGDNGGYISLSYIPFIAVIFQYITDIDPTHKGYPLMRQRTLSSLSGFCQCDNPQISTDKTAKEKTMILDFMVKGFYLE